MQHVQCVMEVMSGIFGRNGKVISQGIDDDDDGLVESLRIPAASTVGARA